MLGYLVLFRKLLVLLHKYSLHQFTLQDEFQDNASKKVQGCFLAKAILIQNEPSLHIFDEHFSDQGIKFHSIDTR